MFTSFLKKTSVIFTLDKHSYGHEATEFLVHKIPKRQNPKMIHCRSHADIFTEASRYKSGYLVIPNYNSIVGDISETRKLTLDYANIFTELNLIGTWSYPLI